MTSTYNLLIATSGLRGYETQGVPWVWRQSRLREVWSRSWQVAWDGYVRRFEGSAVQVRIHGTYALFNVGHPYPLFVQLFETYNAPLVALVRAASLAAGRPITVLDVGAGVGDTALLLGHRCPAAIGELFALEGNPASLRYLQANLERMSLPTHVVHALVSDSESTVRSLLPVHPGTASLTGQGSEGATTIDALWSDGALGTPDVMKLDLDGFDGRALAGARQLIEAKRPAIIFEWSPQHLQATESDAQQAFLVLGEAGYGPFLWYDKYGRFVFIVQEIGRDGLEGLRSISLNSDVLPDWHYDVIALPPERGIAHLPLAELSGLRVQSAPRSSLRRWWRN